MNLLVTLYYLIRDSFISLICILWSCTGNQSKYVCPKCGAPYCSLTCYKSSIHLECTEQFYKECIQEELDVQDSDDVGKKEMIDILKRVYGENEDSGKYFILYWFFIILKTE